MNNTQELMGLEILTKKLIRPAMECLKMIVFRYGYKHRGGWKHLKRG